jgi:ABC-type glycerol-3-phosphate transport system permease component
VSRLHLSDSLWSLVLVYPSFTVPFATWLLMGFFKTIPRDLEEAAMSDGATRFGAMIRVIFPLAGPGLAATAIFSFIAAWNEFLFALTFVKKESLRTLPVALSAFVGQEQADWGAIMAGSVMFTIPVVVFFLAVHKRLTTGMVAGSVTG